MFTSPFTDADDVYHSAALFAVVAYTETDTRFYELTYVFNEGRFVTDEVETEIWFVTVYWDTEDDYLKTWPKLLFNPETSHYQFRIEDGYIELHDEYTGVDLIEHYMKNVLLPNY